MTIKYQLIHGFAWESFTRLLVQIASWTSTIYVARLLTPEDYGVIAIALAVTHILSFLLEIGMADGIIQRDKISEDQLNGVFYISILLAVLLACVVYYLAHFFSMYFNQPLLSEIFEILSFTVFISGFAVMPRAMVLRDLNFKYRALVDVWANMASIIVVVTMATLGKGVWSLVYAYVALQAVLVIGYLIKLKFIPKIKIRYEGLGDIISFGYKLMLSRLLNMIQTRSDVFIAGKYLKTEQVGYYSMALTFATIPAYKVGTMFNTLGFPVLSKVSNDIVSTRLYYLELQKYLFMICIPIFIGLILVSDEFIVALLTEKWMPSVEILRILCIANLFVVMSMMVPTLLAALGKSGLILKANIAITILLFFAIFIGVQFGLLAMGWFISLAQFIVFIFLNSIAIKLLDINLIDILKTLGHVIISSTLMALGVLLVKYFNFGETAISSLIINVIVGVVIYVASYYFLFNSEFTSIRLRLKALRSGHYD